MMPALTKDDLASKAIPDANGCWIFQGALTRGGYGRVSVKAHGVSTRLAHRAAYLLFSGPIPDEQCVLHRCDVRQCINPHHLFLGSRKDNMDDRRAKGRAPLIANRGNLNGSAKLDEATVRLIRELAGQFTNRELGERFGVSGTHISNIRNRKLWAHI